MPLVPLRLTAVYSTIQPKMRPRFERFKTNNNNQKLKKHVSDTSNLFTLLHVILIRNTITTYWSKANPSLEGFFRE